MLNERLPVCQAAQVEVYSARPASIRLAALHRDGGQEHLQQEVLFELRHAAHDQLVLLKGEFLDAVLPTGEQRVQVGLAAAGVLARVRVPDRQHAVRHLHQGLADPFGNIHAQRVEMHLRVGGCHGRLERGCAVDGLRRGLLPCLAPADRPIALDNAQLFRVVDAGDQIDDIHFGVVQAAQDGAHLGQRPLVGARIQGNGGQVHQAHGAVLVVGLPAFALDDFEPQVIQPGFAGHVNQPIGGYFQIVRDFEARALERLLQVR